MKVAVIGSGAIGSLVAGYLKFKDTDVALIGRRHSIEAIKKEGLSILGTRGNIHVDIDCFEKLHEPPAIAVLAVKTQDCAKAVKENLLYLKDATVVTTQNGVQADTIVAQSLPKDHIISSIVMFGSTYLEPAKVVHNFEGPWIFGKFSAAPDATVTATAQLLKRAFPVVIADDIRGMKYLKIFLNANNCIPAILGMSMQESFADHEISGLSIAIWKEALGVVAKAGIKLASLPDFPVSRLTELVSMPAHEAAKIFSQIMTNLSTEPLFGSILQSIKRNRPSEINYINGEFLRLAKEHKAACPLNEKLVKLVYRVEITKRFLSKEQLLAETKAFVHAK